jgi:hypothetical protein
VAPKISIIGIDNRSNLEYRKRLSILFLSNIAQPYLESLARGHVSNAGKGGAPLGPPDPVKVLSPAEAHVRLTRKQSAGARFTNCTKFLINNLANFLLALLSGILPVACPPT